MARDDGHYTVAAGSDPNWPEWYFTLPSGVQVTFTSDREGSEQRAEELAHGMAQLMQDRGIA